LDRIHDLEAVSLVKGNIERIRRPEVCRTMLPVALAKTVLQQSSSTPLVPMQSFDADQRQIPMRLPWPIVFSPLQDAADLSLPLSSYAFSNNRVDLTIVTANARRKLKRDAEAVAGALRGSGFK
jgi:hypothetical protein